MVVLMNSSMCFAGLGTSMAIAKDITTTTLPDASCLFTFGSLVHFISRFKKFKRNTYRKSKKFYCRSLLHTRNIDKESGMRWIIESNYSRRAANDTVKCERDRFPQNRCIKE